MLNFFRCNIQRSPDLVRAKPCGGDGTKSSWIWRLKNSFVCLVIGRLSYVVLELKAGALYQQDVLDFFAFVFQRQLTVLHDTWQSGIACIQLLVSVFDLDLTGNLGNNSSRPLNLGVIVYLLSASAQLFMTTLESHKQLYHKYLNVADMSTEVLKEVGCTD